MIVHAGALQHKDPEERRRSSRTRVNAAPTRGSITTMKMSAVEVSRVLKEGQLEKRSDNLFQLWRRKVCVLTTDSLNIYDDAHKRSKGKELKLQSIKKLDCVERTGKFVYFTIVTTDDKEIDFRCPADDSCWNAVITMALIDFQNRRAMRDLRTLQGGDGDGDGGGCDLGDAAKAAGD